MNFPVAEYLDRIGLVAAPAVSEEGLHLLQGHQFASIPFENFDIQLGRGINLDQEYQTRKLIRNRRGGYCFELNGMLLRALLALGFQARPLLARVHLTGEPSARTHQLSLVEIAGRSWIADAGFGGGGLREPMLLDVGSEISGPFWAFRLVESPAFGYMLQTREEGTWKDSYSFDLSPVLEVDIRLGNHYTSTNPASHFVTERVASLPTSDGRISLKNFTLTTIAGDSKQTREIPHGRPYLNELGSIFGIELGADYADLRPLSTDPQSA